jgi:hypothetical protein
MASKVVRARHQGGPRAESRWLAAMGSAIALIVSCVLGAEAWRFATETADAPQSIPSPLRGEWRPSTSPGAPGGAPGEVPSPGMLGLAEEFITLGDGSLLRVARYMDNVGDVERETWLAVTERETRGMAMTACGRNPVAFVVARTRGTGSAEGQRLDVRLYSGRLDILFSSEPPPPCAQGIYMR